MKKKIRMVLSALILGFCLISPVSADTIDVGFDETYYRVSDLAGVLSEEEVETLTRKIDDVRQHQAFDLAVVTVDNLAGDTIKHYADEVYDSCSLGYGEERDGVLFVLDMENRDWYLSTHGFGTTAFTDAGIARIGEEMQSYLSDGNYLEAFLKFADVSNDLIGLAKDGEPYGAAEEEHKPLSLMWIPISLGIGVVLSLVVVGSMKAKLKTVHKEAAAASYLKKGSMKITERKDTFLYHTVKRTEKKKEESSSKGTTTHKSSSGETHGGGGGKF